MARTGFEKFLDFMKQTSGNTQSVFTPDLQQSRPTEMKPIDFFNKIVGQKPPTNTMDYKPKPPGVEEPVFNDLLYRHDSKPPQPSEHMRKYHPGARPGIEFADFHPDDYELDGMFNKQFLRKRM